MDVVLELELEEWEELDKLEERELELIELERELELMELDRELELSEFELERELELIELEITLNELDRELELMELDRLNDDKDEKLDERDEDETFVVLHTAPVTTGFSAEPPFLST